MKTRLSSRYWFVLLLAITAVGRSAPQELKLDPSQTGAPINPYIYGQFIEHLGRCIYGGIWAEMLEDRKFYFPVTAEYAPYKTLKDTAFPVVGASPWEILGAAAVTMDEDKPFVGDHTPKLAPGAGIRQHDLGVVADKEYVGYIWAKSLTESATDVQVALVWGDKPDDRAEARLKFTRGDYSKKTFSFHAKGTTDHALLELRTTSGAWIGTVSLMPADNVRGLRRDTLELLKKLDGTIYRWPGGNFTSGYDWHDGIGDRDRRPPRKNPAWTGVEHNDFGTDEFIDFCREIHTEPMIAANTGFGDAHSAAEWVEYCNGNATTDGGAKRVRLGHQAPYNVSHWCVGNEMFGPWQLGFMQLNQYTEKNNQVVKAMRKADPHLVLVAVGDIDQINKEYDPQQAKRGIVWSQGMLEASSDYMDLLSEHFYKGRLPWNKTEGSDIQTHVALLKEGVRHKAEAHRKLQPTLPQLKGRVIPISMDEWNYWHRQYVYGELGCIYDLADTLGVAEGLHEYYRQSDLIQMAFYAQTVNVIGAIKTTKTQAETEGTGLVLELYRHHYGTVPLNLKDVFAPFDIAAALAQDGKVLTVSVVNPAKDAAEFKLVLPEKYKATAVTRWHITGADGLAHNAPGKPREIDIHETDKLDPQAALAVPALSCALFEIKL